MCCQRFGRELTRNCLGNKEEGGDDVRSACPLCPGLHTCYNGKYNGLQYREVEPIPKTSPSSDCSLQLDYMKLESLVTADQLRCGEYVLGPCTHRPSSDESQVHPKSLAQPRKGREAPKVRLAIGAKS